MARSQSSLIRRSFSQVDLAFWCIHEHPGQLVVLAMPLLIGVALIASSIALVFRTWDLPVIYTTLLYGLVYPTLSLWILTFAPLPCAVFAWHRSTGQLLDKRECFRFLNRRWRRLFHVAARLALFYPLWFLFAGLPMLWFWPCTCLAPMVALFEDDRRIFKRSRRLLKEDAAVYLLAVVHLCMLLALVALVFLPRGLAATKLFETPLTRALADYLWAFEVLSLMLVACGMSVSWCLSLTLLYANIRQWREGELIRERLQQLREKFAGTSTSPL